MISSISTTTKKASLFLNKKTGKYGFSDTKRKIIIPALFDKTKGFSEGLAAVRVSGKWGFVDKSGKILIEPVYEDVQSFKNGKAKVYTKENVGFIDKSGKLLGELRKRQRERIVIRKKQETKKVK